MSHYSEMDFLFTKTNRDKVSGYASDNIWEDSKQVNKVINNDNKSNIFHPEKYVVFKSKFELNESTNKIKDYYKTKIYKNSNKNPYVEMIEEFSNTPGLRIKASHIAYLRDLGVYPINRLAILRRFPEGLMVSENLENMKVEPISVVVGWIKPDQNFGQIGFNENWSVTNLRFDEKLAQIINKNFKIPITHIIPQADYLQGIVYEFFKMQGLLNTSDLDSKNESYEIYNATKNKTLAETSWGLVNIPVGDPNVLHEGPYRDPNTQNIFSDFNFDLETTYEQKLIGDVDPGSALLDILDNIFTMGTSNMAFYWGDVAPAVLKAKEAVQGKANSLSAWWEFISTLVENFWLSIREIFEKIKPETDRIIAKLAELDFSADPDKSGQNIINVAADLMKSILTSTVAIHRFELRGTIELMTGGDISATPWYITLGNPFSPWIATNHIKVISAKIESSHELGFNDMPQWVKATFSCAFSRSLGKQELMRMVNNSYKRTYNYGKMNVKLDENKLKDLKITREDIINMTPAQQQIFFKENPDFGGIFGPNLMDDIDI